MSWWKSSTPGAWFLAEIVKGVIGQHLEMDGQTRPIEVDTPPLRFLDAPANFALDLRRRKRQALVGARRSHAK